VVTDDHGRVLAAVGSGTTPRPGEDLWRLPAVRHALSGDSVTADSGFGVLRVGDVPLQAGGVAIVLEGYPIGALVLGERLDRGLARLEVARGTHAVVAAGDVVLASTLPGAAAGARWELPHEAGSSARLQMGGEEFVAVTLPLGATESGAPATLYLLRSETAALRPILRSLGFTFLLGGILAVLLVAAATVVVTRTTVRPLSRFVAFMQSGAESRA